MTTSICSKLGLALRAWFPSSCNVALNHIRQVSVTTYNTLNLTGDSIDLVSNCSMLARSQMSFQHANLLEGGGASPSVHQRLESLERACSIASGLNSTISCGALWTQLFSGSLVYETGKDGQFIFTEEEQKDGVKVLSKQVRSPLAILSKVCRLVAKTVGVNNTLQEVGAIDLGDHALSIGCKVSTGANMLASGFSLVENSIGIYSHTLGEGSREENVRSRFQGLRDAMLGFFCDCFDLAQAILGLIYECVPALLGVHAIFILSIVGIIGSALNFVADFIG